MISERLLDPDADAALGALLNTLLLASFVTPARARAVAPIHVAGLCDDASAVLASLARRLGYALAGAVVGDAAAAAEMRRLSAAAAEILEQASARHDQESENAALDWTELRRGSEEQPRMTAEELDRRRRALRNIGSTLVGRIREQSPGPDHPAWADAGTLMHEAGAAEWREEILLGWDEEAHGPAVVRSPLGEADRMAVLVDHALEYLEAWVTADPLLALERRASAWSFARFSAPRGPALATRERREQEWSLVERRTLALGTTVAEGFLASGSAEHLAEGLRKALTCLSSAFSGVFEVVSRPEHGRSVLVEPLGGRRHTVHEHNAEMPYAQGWVALGRLIPLGAGGGTRRPLSALAAREDEDVPLLWLRSPGMAFVELTGVDPARPLAEGLRGAVRRGLEAALAMEGIVSHLATERKIPRDVPPASGRAEARAALEEANDLLHAAGLAHDVPPEDIPDEMRAAAGVRSVQIRGYDVDATVGEWMEALGRQAKGAFAGRSRQRARAKGKRPGRRS